MREYYFDIDKAPKSWDELTSWQIERACHILHARATTRMEKMERLAPILMKVRKGHLLAPLDELAEATDFLFQQSDRTAPPFAKVHIGKGLGRKAAYPPSAELENLTFGEWIAADSDFTAYLNTGTDRHLNRLCACLYRPSKPIWERQADSYNGDRRKPYNAHTLGEKARQWESVSISKKLAIMAFFAGSKAHIADSFKGLFKKGKAKGAGTPWVRVLHQFTDNITQYDAVLSNSLYIVLFSMSETMADAEKATMQ